MTIDVTLPGPKFVQLFGPVLEALKQMGDSATPSEVRDAVGEILGISDEQRAELLESGTSRFDNQVNWARFYLVKANLIDSSQRGVWSLTESGRNATFLTHDDAMETFRLIHTQFGGSSKKVPTVSASADDLDAAVPGEATGDYRSSLIAVLRDLPAKGFERFCQRLLRESDFQQVTVTGRSGDGGIDGIGVLQVNAFVSFKVVFQCKRYQGSVSSSQIRDFRGAMMGRADKGIVITTGTFTVDARKEAVRDGVPPIELVDGQKLIGMLESLELWLRPVKSYEIDVKLFDEFK